MNDFLDILGIGMLDEYDQRKVDRFEKDELIVDTCAVPDSNEPYETGICHPNYNNGEWVIVQMYNSKEEAQKGHNEWVKKMTAPKLPKDLLNVSTSAIAKFIKLLKASAN